MMAGFKHGGVSAWLHVEVFFFVGVQECTTQRNGLCWAVLGLCLAGLAHAGVVGSSRQEGVAQLFPPKP